MKPFVFKKSIYNEISRETHPRNPSHLSISLGQTQTVQQDRQEVKHFQRVEISIITLKQENVVRFLHDPTSKRSIFPKPTTPSFIITQISVL